MKEYPYEEEHEQEYDQEPYDLYEDEEDFYEENVEEVVIGKQGRMQVMAGVTDFVFVILGLIVALAALALLVSLINWVISDLNRSFFVIQTHMQ